MPISRVENSAGLVDRVSTGMRTVDISRNENIPLLMETMGAVSRASDPEQVIDLFSEGMIRILGRRGLMAITLGGLEPGRYRITRLAHDDGTRVIDSKTAWTDSTPRGRHAPVNEGGFFGQLIRTAYPELIHHFHLRDDPVVGNELVRYGSMMAIPIFMDGEPQNWAIFLHRDDEGFNVADLEQAIVRANMVGISARNVQIAQQLEKAHDHIRREVREIASIQRTLLPDRMPDIPGVTLAASYDVFEYAGGDMYDFVPLCPVDSGSTDDGRVRPWAMLIADASGHGPAAAVVMAMIHSIMHTFFDRREDRVQDRMSDAPARAICGPAEMLGYVNRHLTAKRIEGSFVTSFLAFYEPDTRRLTYSRAGHPPPLLKPLGSGRGTTRLEDAGGIPLGVLPDARYDQTSVILKPGQTLVMYTDGITEAMNHDGEMFGIEGIEHALVECSGEAGCTIESIGNALRTHESDKKKGDDQTIVALQVLGKM